MPQFFKNFNFEEKKEFKNSPTPLISKMSSPQNLMPRPVWEPTFFTNTQRSHVSGPQISHTFGWATWGGITPFPQLAQTDPDR